MKETKEYNSDNVQRLKRFLTDMAVQGHVKYFEILVDGIKVVHKTDRMEHFDHHAKWMDRSAQSMRVMVYNTKNSHRSQIFEFRTEYYREGISDKLYPTRKPRLSEDEINCRVQKSLDDKQKHQTFVDLQQRNQELIRRLGDAEAYILKLETPQEEKKGDSGEFDLNGLFTKAMMFANTNPDLKDKLGGIQNLFKKEDNKSRQDAEKNDQAECTFRRKPSNESSAPEARQEEDTPVEDGTMRIDVSFSKLDDEKGRKISELAHFLSQYPEYIDMIYELMKSEEIKLTKA